MAIYLRLGPPDQQGWIRLTEERTADGRFVVLLKEGVTLDVPKLRVLNELLGDVAIYLRLGPADQREWINMPGRQKTDGRVVVLIKEDLSVSAPMLPTLNDVISTESSRSTNDGWTIAGTG